MTPNDLYARAPADVVVDDLDALKGFYYDHLPEVDAMAAHLAPIVAGPLKGRFELRFYRRHNYDGRRVWWLYALWFDGKPVMILQNAGREGDDHYRRIVTDASRLGLAVSLLRAHLAMPEIEVVDPTKDVDGLCEFYGDRLGSP
jgi:hypothetical protein